MKAALIPPVPHLERWGEGGLHLVLTHLLTIKAYLDHYKEQRRRGAYLILDNSAHEFKEALNPLVVLNGVRLLSAQEVVAPDVLWDADRTLARSSEALDTWGDSGLFASLHPRVMLVPQGKDRQAWNSCLSGLAWKFKAMMARYPLAFPEPPVIGISKDYEVWEGGIPKLIEDRATKVHELMGADVHLLGWSRDLWTLEEISTRFPWIRSTDSAKPFVYALNGISLHRHKGTPEYPTRPDDYFNSRLTDHQAYLAQVNVEVFRALAGDRRV